MLKQIGDSSKEKGGSLVGKEDPETTDIHNGSSVKYLGGNAFAEGQPSANGKNMRRGGEVWCA